MLNAGPLPFQPGLLFPGRRGRTAGSRADPGSVPGIVFCPAAVHRFRIYVFFIGVLDLSALNPGPGKGNPGTRLTPNKAQDEVQENEGGPLYTESKGSDQFFFETPKGPEGGTFDPRILQGTSPYDHDEGVPRIMKERGTPDPLSPEGSVEAQV